MLSSNSLDSATACTSYEFQNALDLSARSGAENCILLHNSLDSCVKSVNVSKDDNENSFIPRSPQLDSGIASPVLLFTDELEDTALAPPYVSSVVYDTPNKLNSSVVGSGPRRVLTKKGEQILKQSQEDDEVSDPIATPESRMNMHETTSNPSPLSPIPVRNRVPSLDGLTVPTCTPIRARCDSLGSGLHILSTPIATSTSSTSGTPAKSSLQTRNRDATLLSASAFRSPQRVSSISATPATPSIHSTLARLRTPTKVPGIATKGARESVKTDTRQLGDTVLPRAEEAAISTKQSAYCSPARSVEGTPQSSPYSPSSSSGNEKKSASTKKPVSSDRPISRIPIPSYKTKHASKHIIPLRGDATSPQHKTRTSTPATTPSTPSQSAPGPAFLSAPATASPPVTPPPAAPTTPRRSPPSRTAAPSSPFSYSVSSLFGRAYVQKVRTAPRVAVASRGSVLDQDTLNSSINLSFRDGQEFVPNETKHFKRSVSMPGEKNATRRSTSIDMSASETMSARETSRSCKQIHSALESTANGGPLADVAFEKNDPDIDISAEVTRAESDASRTISWRYRPSGKSDPVTRRMQMLRSFERQKRLSGRSGILTNL